jgi:hypothetical protein
MGQNRWWLKLFFYLLDVGTSNALILYREAMANTENKMSIVEFKKHLVLALVGPKIHHEIANPIIVHELTRTVIGRYRCAYCSLFSTSKKTTRYKCSGCNIPLCSIGSGKKDNDCFTLCHSNESLRKAAIAKHEAMLLKTNIDQRMTNRTT